MYSALMLTYTITKPGMINSLNIFYTKLLCDYDKCCYQELVVMIVAVRNGNNSSHRTRSTGKRNTFPVVETRNRNCRWRPICHAYNIVPSVSRADSLYKRKSSRF
ncbi:hypothetical protein V1477_007088 [Vespula maculifrons]|uniref:Uncharacterized protein n=1 Tax=Vespula maculifrons TaxID=7453 RepID=A0ABD2CHJ6_VESMC